MTKELAKTLTLALVNYIDENRPEGTMDCSSGECVSLEKAFTEDNFDSVETLIKKKLSRLTEFEEGLVTFYNKRNMIPSDKDGVYNKHELEEFLHESAKTLLAIAKKELLTDDELSKKYFEGYTKGYGNAEKHYNESVAYHFPTMPTTPVFGCDGIHCTNPQMDCINCPRRTGGGFNTASGTSTAILHGNTSATDGKEHNPSFTD